MLRIEAYKLIQSTLVISKSKRPSQTLRDIWTSTYQIYSIEEKTIWTTNFYKWNLTPLNRNVYWKYCEKRGEIAPQEQFLLFSTIFYNLILDFCVITRTRFFLRDKRLFEITEVEITRVDCILNRKKWLAHKDLAYNATTFHIWFQYCCSNQENIIWINLIKIMAFCHLIISSARFRLR